MRRTCAKSVRSTQRVGGVVGVVGASGGVGTSCLAAALATRAVRCGATAVCVDAVPFEGGIDALFDLETNPGARWPDLAPARGRIDGAALLRHLPASADGVRVLAAVIPAGGSGVRPAAEEDSGSSADPYDERLGPPPQAGAPTPREDIVTALAGAADVVVVDLGQARADSAAAAAAARCTDVILVVGAGVPALARAATACELVETMTSGRLWLVQRAPRGRADLGDLVAARLDRPLLGVLLDDPHLDDDLARGVAPGARRGRLADAVEAMWATLADQEQAA